MLGHAVDPIGCLTGKRLLAKGHALHSNHSRISGMNGVPKKVRSRDAACANGREQGRTKEQTPSPAAGEALRLAANTLDGAERLTIEGRSCKLVCVDDVLPHHRVSRKGGRPRLLYADNEVSHFDLGGHRYALVIEDQRSKEGQPAETGSGSSSDIVSLLTSRELEIVQLISTGYLAKQVAVRLRISEFTVRSYLKTIYCKLGVRSRGAMVYRYAQALRRVV